MQLSHYHYSWPHVLYTIFTIIIPRYIVLSVLTPLCIPTPRHLKSWNIMILDIIFLIYSRDFISCCEIHVHQWTRNFMLQVIICCCITKWYCMHPCIIHHFYVNYVVVICCVVSCSCLYHYSETWFDTLNLMILGPLFGPFYSFRSTYLDYYVLSIHVFYVMQLIICCCLPLSLFIGPCIIHHFTGYYLLLIVLRHLK